jgi:hypothetical protein
MVLLTFLVTVITNFMVFAHETGKFTLSYRQHLMISEDLDNQKLQIAIFNKTTKPQRFIFYQKDNRHNQLNNRYFVYVWNSRLLTNKAYWKFTLPLAFQVAGLSGDAEDYSTTNIENANYGQIWQLIQQKPEGTEFSIKKTESGETSDTIRIENQVNFARRRAVLMKGESLLIGTDLSPNEDINFSIKNSFYIALSKEYKKNDVIDFYKINQEHEVKYQSTESVEWYEIDVIEDPHTGRISFEDRLIPRLPLSSSAR